MLAIGKPLTVEQRMLKATTDLIGRDEFTALAGVLMIGTKRVVDGLPTACTNGRDEAYGREFVESLGDAEFRFLMLHECYHKMYRHLTTWRHLYKMDRRKANMACDYVINHKLVNTDACRAEWIVMPKGGLFDDKYAGMNAQQVFNMLSDDGDDEKDKGKGGGTGINPFDDHDWESAEQLSEEEEQQLAKEVDEAVRQGVLAAGKLGTGGTRDMVELLEPKKDWRELLREYVTTTCSGKDYSTWRKPNRRYVGMDMLMPSTISESMNDIVVAIDMSGSIGTEEQIAFLSEVKGICEQVNPNKVHVMYWDTEVCGHEVYLQDELDTLTKSTKPVGGGGTMVECVPTYMAEHNIKPECVVVLTDGYLGGSWGQWAVPVLWCIHNNKHASPSAGVAIHI